MPFKPEIRQFIVDNFLLGHANCDSLNNLAGYLERTRSGS